MASIHHLLYLALPWKEESMPNCCLSTIFGKHAFELPTTFAVRLLSFDWLRVRSFIILIWEQHAYPDLPFVFRPVGPSLMSLFAQTPINQVYSDGNNRSTVMVSRSNFNLTFHGEVGEGSAFYTKAGTVVIERSWFGTKASHPRETTSRETADLGSSAAVVLTVSVSEGCSVEADAAFTGHGIGVTGHGDGVVVFEERKGIRGEYLFVVSLRHSTVHAPLPCCFHLHGIPVVAPPPQRPSFWLYIRG